MLVELLRPCGPELARRWLAALMVVPSDERETVVTAIESRIMAEYSGASAAGEPGYRTHVSAPVQRDGYVEQVMTTYEVVGEGADVVVEHKPERRRA